MYAHILVPTDGSKLSAKAIKTGVRMARALGAKLTGVYVMSPYAPAVYGEAAIYVPEVSPQAYRKHALKAAKRALAALEIEAQTAGVQARTMALTDGNPWQAIIRAARGKKCDLIVMASHGRRGLAGFILGSETTKVLTHSKVPVLVCR